MILSLIKYITDLDKKIILKIRNHRHPLLTKILMVITHSGSGTTWIAVAIILLILEMIKVDVLVSQTTVLRSMACALIAWWIGSLIKKKVNRPRPEETIPGFEAEIRAPKCQSFPSSHTSSAVALYVALWMSVHSYTPAVGYWALLVSFSRVYLGVHFPSDLLGGAILGMICGIFIIPINILFM